MAFLALKLVDASSELRGRACSSERTRPLFLLDASTEVSGRVQFELSLRPSKILTRQAFGVDAYGIFEKRVQTRLHCVQESYGRVWGGTYV